MIAWPTLRNSQVSGREDEATLVFTSLQYCCFPSCFCLSCSGVYQYPSTSWPITLQPLGSDQAIIPHMKEHWCSFHMRYRNLICYKRLQRFGMIMWPWELPLVCFVIWPEPYLNPEGSGYSIWGPKDDCVIIKLRTTLSKFVEFWALIRYFGLAWVRHNHFVNTNFSKLNKEIADPSDNAPLNNRTIGRSTIWSVH